MYIDRDLVLIQEQKKRQRMYEDRGLVLLIQKQTETNTTVRRQLTTISCRRKTYPDTAGRFVGPGSVGSQVHDQHVQEARQGDDDHIQTVIRACKYKSFLVLKAGYSAGITQWVKSKFEIERFPTALWLYLGGS